MTVPGRATPGGPSGPGVPRIGDPDPGPGSGAKDGDDPRTTSKAEAGGAGRHGDVTYGNIGYTIMASGDEAAPAASRAAARRRRSARLPRAAEPRRLRRRHRGEDPVSWPGPCGTGRPPSRRCASQGPAQGGRTEIIVGWPRGRTGIHCPGRPGRQGARRPRRPFGSPFRLTIGVDGRAPGGSSSRRHSSGSGCDHAPVHGWPISGSTGWSQRPVPRSLAREKGLRHYGQARAAPAAYHAAGHPRRRQGPHRRVDGVLGGRPAPTTCPSHRGLQAAASMATVCGLRPARAQSAVRPRPGISWPARRPERRASARPADPAPFPPRSPPLNAPKCLTWGLCSRRQARRPGSVGDDVPFCKAYFSFGGLRVHLDIKRPPRRQELEHIRPLVQSIDSTSARRHRPAQPRVVQGSMLRTSSSHSGSSRAT